MGVVSAINAMNASMNATRLSSVNLASALETYAAVIANPPPPPPYSCAPPSPVEASQNEARGMCFTHAAVFWMEWATIQANLQLSLMQDLFKLKSLADLAGERQRGIDINIDPQEFDELEARGIRSMVVKLTKLSHDSFQEGYKKGADWNGIGGLDYWVTQADHYDATVAHHTPRTATSKASYSSSTLPCPVASTVDLEAAAEATRVEQDKVSLRRKHNNGDLRGSNKTSDNDSNSSRSKRSRLNDELDNERWFSDISGAFRRNARRIARVACELPDSESDYDDVQVLCRYPGEVDPDNPDSDIYLNSPTSHQQLESGPTGTTDIGPANSPAGHCELTDACPADVLSMASPAEDFNRSLGVHHQKSVISYEGTAQERDMLLDDSENEGRNTGNYSSAFSSSGSSSGSDFDNFFCNAVDHPALQVSRGQGAETHKQASASGDKEDGAYNNYLAGKITKKTWLEGICSARRSVEREITLEDTDWQTIDRNANAPYFPDFGQSTTSGCPETHIFHDLLYAITEEGTLRGTPPRIGRINARSIFPTTSPESSEYTEETRRIPTKPGIRRKGKFHKSNGYLEMLTAEDPEDIWKNAGFSEEEYLIHKEPESERQHQISNYPHQQLEISMDVRNIVDLPRHSGLGYFTEDFEQREALLDKERAHSRWSRLSCVSEEPQPATQQMIKRAGQVEETSTLLGRMRHNCFTGGEVDSE